MINSRLIATGLAILLGFTSLSVFAQPPSGIMFTGDAAVTGFAGTLDQDNVLFDRNGPSVRIVPLPQSGPFGLREIAKRYTITAGEVGQVFGIALDDAPQPTIFVAATSAYGLAIYQPNQGRLKHGMAGAQFMPGQFGPSEKGGGPGSIWRIDGQTGAVTLFANVSYNGIENKPGSLGGLAFDPTTRQLFVADRSTGMVHRFSLDGIDQGVFDHGVQGLSAAGLEPVPFDPATLATISSPHFNVENSETWGIAPPPRRVFALAVHEHRLFYSVWGAQIWSVGITAEGAFADDARVEVDSPSLQPDTEISSIAFDNAGYMYVAERGAPTGDYNFVNVANSGQERVKRFAPKLPTNDSPYFWEVPGDEYAIGMPPDYQNADGGVSPTCGGIVWSTGDRLLETGGTDNFPYIDGLQGNDKNRVKPDNMPPLQSWYVNYYDNQADSLSRGHMGAIVTLTNCGGASGGYGVPSAPPSYGFWPPMCPPRIIFLFGYLDCYCPFYGMNEYCYPPLCPPLFDWPIEWGCGFNCSFNEGPFINIDCFSTICPPLFGGPDGGLCNSNCFFDGPLFNNNCFGIGCLPWWGGAWPWQNGCNSNCSFGGMQFNYCFPMNCSPLFNWPFYNFCDCQHYGQCFPPPLECPPGLIYFNGQCVPPPCPPDQTYRDGRCVPPPCPPDQTYRDGRCVPPPCPPDQTYRDGRCVPPPCPPDQTYRDGRCVPPPCPPDQTYRDGRCVPPPCPPDHTYRNGHCTPPPCPPNQTYRDGRCVPPPCPPDQTYRDGRCVPPPCPPDQTYRDGRCVPPPCPPDQTYRNGHCTPPPCPPNQTYRDGRCVPPPCPSDQIYRNGRCVPPPCSYNQIYLNGKCVTPPSCRPNQRLVNGICVTPPTCKPNQRLVNGYCITQPTCGPRQRLINGICVTQPLCKPNQRLVNGYCVTQPTCRPNQRLVNGICITQPTCKPNQRLVDGHCITQPTTCGARQQLINGHCVTTPYCKKGEVLRNGYCVPTTSGQRCPAGQTMSNGHCITKPQSKPTCREGQYYYHGHCVTLPRNNNKLPTTLNVYQVKPSYQNNKSSSSTYQKQPTKSVNTIYQQQPTKAPSKSINTIYQQQPTKVPSKSINTMYQQQPTNIQKNTTDQSQQGKQ